MVTLMLGEQVNPGVTGVFSTMRKGMECLAGDGFLSWFAVCGRITCIDERATTLTGREYFVYNPVAPRRRTSLNAH